MSVDIPLISTVYPSPNRDLPITPRENLMLALSHEKPVWMPNLYADSQCLVSRCNRDTAPRKDAAGYDWFGTYYEYSPAQFSNTPVPSVLQDISLWETKIKWPDLKAVNWASDMEGFVRDEEKALFTRMSNGPFERLHFFEGFEQALVDMLTEPEVCRDFFERYVDHKIELFNHMRDIFPFDFIVAADDYGTARAPFFSPALFEEVLMEPTSRFVKAVHDRGTKFVAHCCGRIDAFIPYFAEMGVDGLEIQTINDISSIYEKYGDKLTVEYRPEPNIVFNSESSETVLRDHIKWIVDTYGAHVVNGSGVIMNVQCSSKDGYYQMEDELFEYSRNKYSTLHKRKEGMVI